MFRLYPTQPQPAPFAAARPIGRGGYLASKTELLLSGNGDFLPALK